MNKPRIQLQASIDPSRIDDTLVREHEAEVAAARAWVQQHVNWRDGTTKTLAAANQQIERMGRVLIFLLKDKLG